MSDLEWITQPNEKKRNILISKFNLFHYILAEKSRNETKSGENNTSVAFKSSNEKKLTFGGKSNFPCGWPYCLEGYSKITVTEFLYFKKLLLNQ